MLSNKFSDNLLLGFSAVIFSKHQFYSKLTIRKSNFNETQEKIFLTHVFNEKTEQRHAYGFWYSELYSLWHTVSDKMFVYCDICEPYMTGDVYTSLLRIVPIEIREL